MWDSHGYISCLIIFINYNATLLVSTSLFLSINKETINKQDVELQPNKPKPEIHGHCL